jgi:hypothetical protein
MKQQENISKSHNNSKNQSDNWEEQSQRFTAQKERSQEDQFFY